VKLAADRFDTDRDKKVTAVVVDVGVFDAGLEGGRSSTGKIFMVTPCLYSILFGSKLCSFDVVQKLARIALQ